MRNAFTDIEQRIDAVFFDFDGVILESVDIKTAAFKALFADEPAHLDAIVALHQRHGGVSRFVKFEMIYRDILKRPLSAECLTKLGRKFEGLVLDAVAACPMVRGAQAVLDCLRGRVPMIVVSGTPEDELVDIVRRRELDHYFVSVHGSPRTKASIIREQIDCRRWKPERAVMVGDAMTDYDAACATGVVFVGRVPAGQDGPFPAATVVIDDLTHFDDAICRVATKASMSLSSNP
jgi:beta-phosphoglucomutase-like phosphatase (HAD superfamily)